MADLPVLNTKLEQFLDRLLNIEAQKEDLAADRKQIMAEAKAAGYDTSVLSQMVKRAKRNDRAAVVDADRALFEAEREAGYRTILD